MIGGPAQLPPAVSAFVGRSAELVVLDGLLASATDTLPVLLVSGTAGVGKTTTVTHWAHRVRARFPDGQLYLDLRGYAPGEPVGAEEALARLLRGLGVPGERIPAELDDRISLYRTLLDGRRVLVLLDNARTVAQVHPLLPGASTCAVVVTSRDALSGLVVRYGARRLELAELPVADGVALLRELVGERVSRETDAAAALVQRCARLPLALRLAAELAVTRAHSTLARLADELAEAQRLDQLDAGGAEGANVRHVFSWSYDNLAAPDARVFRLLGLHPGPEHDVYAVAALAGLGTTDAQRHLDALSRAHLVRPDGAGRYRLHDLLREYAAELTALHDEPSTRDAAARRLFDYYLHTASLADRLLAPYRSAPAPHGDPPGSAPALRTYDAALRWVAGEADVLIRLCAWPGPAWDTRRAALAFALRSYFFLTKNWDAWLGTHRHALAAALRVSDRLAEADIRNNLGFALLEAGDRAGAVTAYEHALRIFEELDDAPGALNTRANYAAALARDGRHDAALSVTGEVLLGYRDIDDRWRVAITMRGLALIESRLDRWSDAIGHLKQVIDMCTELGLDLDLAMAWNSLGEMRRHAGDPAAAEDAHHRALVAGERCASRFELARAHQGIGQARLALHDRVGACARWHTALTMFEELRAPQAEELRAQLHALGPVESTVESVPAVISPRVFVSYAHDSEQHKNDVLSFAGFLRDNGIDARLDRWATDRRRDWFTWVINEVTAADYVIVVASAAYREAADGAAPSGRHPGAQSEASLLRDLLHRDRASWVCKLIPVLIGDCPVQDIPLFLQPYSADHYRVAELTEQGADVLLRTLTNRPAHPIPRLGPPSLLLGPG